MEQILSFIPIAKQLEEVGLIWQPEIGDEILERGVENDDPLISILVDPNGMTPKDLRLNFVWLPSVEQLITQFEARQAVLFHAGLDVTQEKFCYKTIIQVQTRQIEGSASSFRSSLGIALRNLMVERNTLH
jgi:hypothetical protein